MRVLSIRAFRPMYALGLCLGQLFVILGLFPNNLLASEPQQQASFARTAWRIQEGLPENTVQAIQQTAAGYLWVGTTGGAVRFDGSHFTAIATATEGSIFSMLAAKDGSLWMGTEGSGLLHLRNGKVTAVSVAQGLTDGFVRVLLEDHHGRIWVGTDNGLFWVEGDRARLVYTSPPATPLSVHALMQDGFGRIWVGGSTLLIFPPNADPERGNAGVFTCTLPGAFSANRVKSILQTSDQTIWIGTVNGLDRLKRGHLASGCPGKDNFEHVPGVLGTVRTMLQTDDGLLWVGTIGHGLYVHHPHDLNFTHVTTESWGSINTVLSLFEDDSRQLWIGSQDGLFRMRHTPVRIVPLPGDTAPDFATVSADGDDALWAVSSRVYRIQNGRATPVRLPGLGNIPIRNLFRDRAGTLWIGTDGSGVYHQTSAGLVHYLAPTRLVNNFPRAFLEASDGTMWIATDEGVSHTSGDRIDNLHMADGLAYFSTRCLLEDRDRDIWIGTERGLSHWSRGRFVHDALTSALAHEKIWSMLQDSDGSLWFGTRDHGLYHWPAGRKQGSPEKGSPGQERLEHFTTMQGLDSDGVYQLLERSHRLWMSGPNGISSFALEPPSRAGSTRLATTVYDLPDDASAIQMYGGRQPAGLIDAHGNLWFPSTRGVLEVIPDLPVEQQAPRVNITAITADGQTLDPQAKELVLKPSLNRLQIAFAPMLLRPQNGLRFRYRLDGLDTTWIDAGPTRVAAYTSLPAANYRFRVEVFESDHPDQVSQATFALRIPPHIYKTPWFLTLCGVAATLLTWSFYTSRLRQVRLRFNAVIDERNRVAREMHDTVIQGCTGISALLEGMASLDAGQPMREDLLEHARTQVRSTIDEARQAVWNLRNTTAPREDLPLRLERFAAQARQDLGTEVVCVVEGPSLPLDDLLARELLMVAREAVYNAVLHGASKRIVIQLQRTRRSLILEVRDDGTGFDPSLARPDSALHYGIAGMRERVGRIQGEFTLISGIGEGTIVRAVVDRAHLERSVTNKVAGP